MVCREFSLIWSLILFLRQLHCDFFGFSSSQYQQYVKLIFNATEPVISSPAAEWCLCLLHILCCLSSVIIISLFPFEERSLHRVWGFETCKSRKSESIWHHGYVWIHSMWNSCSHPLSHTTFTKGSLLHSYLCASQRPTIYFYIEQGYYAYYLESAF